MQYLHSEVVRYTVHFKNFVVTKLPLKKTPIETVKNTDTPNCFLRVDFFNILTHYLLERFFLRALNDHHGPQGMVYSPLQYV